MLERHRAMNNMQQKAVFAAVFALLLLAAEQVSACSNGAVPGSSPTRRQWQRFGSLAAAAPASAYFRFTIFEDGTFQARNILDSRPSGVCTTQLYAKLDLTTAARKVYFIARKRTRSRILTLKARGLPPVSEYGGEVPVLNLQTRTSCDGAASFVSNVYARYLKCGAAGMQPVGPKRYPSRLAERIR